jgi:hypothetical protein
MAVLHLFSIFLEAVIVVIALLLAVHKKRLYGYGFALTFGIYVVYDLANPLRHLFRRAHHHLLHSHTIRTVFPLATLPGNLARTMECSGYFEQHEVRSFHVLGSRTPVTTCRIASLTSAGWSCWMLWRRSPNVGLSLGSAAEPGVSVDARAPVEEGTGRACCTNM